MKWIEIKMRELGVSTHSGYRVTAFLDNTAMVTVHTGAERWLPIPCYFSQQTRLQRWCWRLEGIIGIYQGYPAHVWTEEAILPAPVLQYC